MASTKRLLTVLAGLGAMLVACDHGGGSGIGALEVHWQIKGSKCALAGVSTVQVSVLVAETSVAAQTAACEDGQVVFEGLEAGTYEVQVDGLDTAGSAAWSATAQGVRVRGGDDTDSVALELTHVGSGLSLSWYFENSGLCSFNGVAQVDVTIWYDEITMFHQVYACDPFADPNRPPPEDGVLGILVPDLPVAAVDVALFGLDGNGIRRFTGDKHVQLEDGRVVNVSVALVACEGPCS